MLNSKGTMDKIVYCYETQTETETSKEIVYKSFRNGLCYKQNLFFSGQELRLSIGLNVDDFATH